jgi:hypothetical protein
MTHLSKLRDAIRKLYLHSGNECAFSGCHAHLFNNDGVYIADWRTSRPPSEPSPCSSTPSPSPSPVLPDGRSAVYLTAVNATKNTVSFDLIEFLTGGAAKAEWKKQHPDTADGPDNDYMIVNNNEKLRTLPVAADAKCVVLSTLGGTDTKTIGFAALPAFLKQHNKGMELTPPQISILPFWLTVKDGTVTKFEEQFLP